MSRRGLGSTRRTAPAVGIPRSLLFGLQVVFLALITGFLGACGRGELPREVPLPGGYQLFLGNDGVACITRNTEVVLPLDLAFRTDASIVGLVVKDGRLVIGEIVDHQNPTRTGFFVLDTGNGVVKSSLTFDACRQWLSNEYQLTFTMPELKRPYSFE